MLKTKTLTNEEIRNRLTLENMVPPFVELVKVFASLVDTVCINNKSFIQRLKKSFVVVCIYFELSAVLFTQQFFCTEVNPECETESTQVSYTPT